MSVAVFGFNRGWCCACSWLAVLVFQPGCDSPRRVVGVGSNDCVLYCYLVVCCL